MSTKYEVSIFQRELLKRALIEPRFQVNAKLSGIVCQGMVWRGWLTWVNVKTPLEKPVYEITDAGRAVARQLGIGGGASPDYVNGGEK